MQDSELGVFELELGGAIVGVVLVLTFKLLEEGVVVCPWETTGECRHVCMHSTKQLVHHGLVGLILLL